MNFKFKSALVALALLAMGAAHAGPEYILQGKVKELHVQAASNDNNVSVRLESGNCNGHGALGLVRNVYGIDGGAPMTDKSHSSAYSLLLAAHLAGKEVTVIVDYQCTVKSVKSNG